MDAAFCSSLALAGCSAESRTERAPRLREHAERLSRWADGCPENFGHCAALVAGEVARVEGRDTEALELFAEAVASARSHRFVHVEALAHESAARACREQGLDASAAAHVREAIACYRRWGAGGKAAELEAQFPSLAAPAGDHGTQALDALAVVKASQAISGEIVLDRLLEKLLEAVIAQAGARSGALLLARRRRLLVAATAEATEAGPAVTIYDPPIEPSADLVAESVVNYVSRTREPLILGDAAARGAFASDPYVIRRSVKSVLCAPILAQRELRGVLYVENDLIADAFTNERLAVLEVLAGQAAISLENATLYTALRHEIAERQRSEAGLRASEEQLRQAQKMEAVGRLAGGIAHDFNNLLTAIGGYSMLALERLDADDPAREDLEQIQRAGEQAAALTRQLLAFSRKQVLAPQLLEIDGAVAGLEAMLRRLIGEDVELLIESAPDVGVIRADRAQLEQIILNLALNARDAMPRGGRLTIEAGNVALDERAAAERGAAPGAFVTLTVGDTGLGMDAATRARIFEPFFTTKPTGKGTGLGLSTVYGIVQQSGGYMSVDSEVGRGSSFTVYLPRVDAAAEAFGRAATATAVPGGSETILLVEDEELVRNLVAGSLERLGYTVLRAVDGPDALRVQGHHQRPIHLMITDVVMPQLSGPELARRIAPLAPEMAVLFVSGYAADDVLGHDSLDPAAAYVQKPFTPDALARKAREVLDRARL